MTRWVVANPRKTLMAWGAVVCILGLIGFGVDQRLHRTNVLIGNTSSGQAQALQTQRFGEGSDLIILLQGPTTALNDQGPRISRALDANRKVSVVSPWTPGLDRSLRPRPDRAILLARIHEPFEHASRYTVVRMRHLLDREARPPLTAHLTGYADIAHATFEESVKAVRTAELIAAPVLMIILLLVFRSPLAAGIPLLLGMTTVGAATGMLDLLNRGVALDAVSLNLASMLGLALGVDYSLLMVFRFREELAKGLEARPAAQAASVTAGRTVRFAGFVLGAAMLSALLVTPGKILVSLVAGTLIGVVISVVTASIALPAILALLGERINLWRFGRASEERGAVAATAIAVLRRPALTGGLVLLALLLFAIPALAIKSGPPDPRALPDSSQARKDFAAIRKALRGNWAAPYEVTIATHHGAITDPRRLRAIQRWEEQLAANRRVDLVLGPGDISEKSSALAAVTQDLARGRAQLSSSQQALGRFNHGLSRAAGGTRLLGAGLSRASTGAQRLALGGSQGADGAARLQAGMSRAARGVSRLQAGLDRTSPALQRLANGAQRAARGTGRIRRGIVRIAAAAQQGLPQIAQLRQNLLDASAKFDQLRLPIGIANQQLAALRSALEQMGPAATADPQYANATQALDGLQSALTGRAPGTGAALAPGYDGVDAALQTASSGAIQAADGVSQILSQTSQLLDGTSRLNHGTGLLRYGLARISAGSTRLSNGGSKAANGTTRLSHGLSRLRDGSGALSDGLDRLHGGAERLAAGLNGGTAKTARLESGMGRLKRGGQKFETRSARFQRQFQGTKRLGRLLGSGYATLAAIDTSSEGSRTAASTAVNLDRGGDAARVLVVGDGRVPPKAPTQPGDPLRGILEHSGAGLARKIGADVRVGGPAATLQDLDVAVSGALPWLVLLLCAVTYVVLVPLLRSLLLPLLAVVLNLLTVATALGVMVLAFQGSAPLGGPGFIDDIMLTTVFSIVLALSVDYQVFLLARMREGYDLTGDPDAAIEYGLRHTAGVITGAALIMCGVFIAFALAPIISLRELGVGLTVAVLLDATLVRLVLLPAAMRLIGGRIWWLPAWLDRLLPRPSTESQAEVPASPSVTTPGSPSRA